MTTPRKFISRSVQLKLGKTETAKTLYSAAVSTRYGPGARVQIYFGADGLPDPAPATVSVMLYKDARPEESENTSVHNLRRTSFHSKSVRYDEYDPGDVSVGSIYFPKRMMGADPPAFCYLEVAYEPPTPKDSRR